MSIKIEEEIYDSETGELLNKVEEVEVEIVEDHLPSIICKGGTYIQTNSAQLEKELIKYLIKYDIEVTAETEKIASKSATELNKLSKDLNSSRLAVAKEIKKPADELKSKIDSLIVLIQDKRESIISKVDVFKSKRFDKIRELLKIELSSLYANMNIEESFKTVDIEILVKEGSLANVALTKSAKEQLNGMVLAVKGLQDSVKIRLLQLEKNCREKGLDIPIEEDEIQHILFLDEADYSNGIQDMIAGRIKIAAKILEKEKERQLLIKQQEEDRVKRQEEQKQLHQQREEDRQLAEKEKILKEKSEEEKTTGKKIIRVVATFDVEVNLNVSDEKVMNQYENKLKEIFTTFISVTPF